MAGPTQGSDPPERPSSPLADTVPASSPPEHATEHAELPPAGNRYRLGAELGRGGMGRVVEAFDTQLGRTVALKEVLPNASANVERRFVREIQITARLEHASIVPLYDSGVIDGRPYYVMRRVTGRPLDQLIDRARGLDDRLALLPNVAAAIDAIAHAHRRGVIHRDLKPQNILVGELGETVVIDWGLAKVVGETDPDADPVETAETKVPTAADSLKTQIGAVFGTPGFMAPEQARGEELDQRGDVFALGATLYHLLVGKPPVTGKSATEMIASTMQHKIVPVTRQVPEAPAELVTIIDKALAADPKARYGNAGALSEDVRRFLTGQLVAAHRYTSWQRVSRFAKRHRAALAVAAAASVAVAVLAWVSVHRVITERDAARAARADAELERMKADEKAVELRQRADELVIAQARSLIATNPTEAVALLKQLDGSAPAVLDEARALVKSAITRGVAHGLPSVGGMTIAFEMSPDGKRIVQANTEGEMQVIDLDLNRAVVTRSLGRGNRATWVDNGKRLLIQRSTEPPQLFDIAKGTLDAIGTEAITDYDKSADGELVAYRDAKKNIGIIDVAAGTASVIWTSGKTSDDVKIAPDGSFIAFGEWIDAKTSRVVVIDRAGKILVEKPGRGVIYAVSPAGKLAVSLYDDVFEVRPRDPAPAFTKVVLDAGEAHLVHYLSYRGETLQLFAMRSLLSWNGKTVWRSEPISDTLYYGQEAGDGMYVIAADDNRVHLRRDGLHLDIPLTSRPEGIVRIASVRGSTRVAATSADAVLVWDIADLLPKQLDGLPGMFVDERHILIEGGTTPDWHVVDVETGADQTLAIRPYGLPMGVDIAADGRIATVIEHASPTGTPMRTTTVISADHAHVEQIPNGRVARLIPDDGILVGMAQGRVFGRVGKADPKQLFTVDGEVRDMCPTGPGAFAVLSTAGELVRGKLDGTVTDRKRVDIVRNSFITCDAVDGSVLVASGNRLMRWHVMGGELTEVARFIAEPAGTISALYQTQAGLFVTLANKEMLFLPEQGDHTAKHVPLAGEPVAAERGALVASTSTAGEVELLDLPSLAKWTLPAVLSGHTEVQLSPDGTRLLQSRVEPILWHLPKVGHDYGVWLDELTNADLTDGHLTWPWQQATNAPISP